MRLAVQAACLLPETPPASGPPNPDQQPYWTPEHSRLAGSRAVKVEVVVNGRPAASQNLTADGSLRELTFDAFVERSSWVALRILGSAHTNPIFVVMGGEPIRASRKSAEWCLQGVDQCWKQKSPRIQRSERESAERAYEHARVRYRQILSDSQSD